MTVHVYKLECLTNLHVGSGEVNYHIIDNEVERDPVTGDPIIHASGVKGAIREFYTGKLTENQIKEIFGKAPKSKEEIAAGSYKFFDACLIARPMRVSNSATMSSIPVVSIAAVNSYLRRLSVFGCNHYGVEKIELDERAFGNNEFLTNCPNDILVEGESTGKLPDAAAGLMKLKDVLGDTFAVAKRIENYALPVMARNHLENGESKNLWYEEVVPHGSVFYQLILTPNETMALTLEKDIIQIGGNASIGCGYVKFTGLTRKN